MKINFIDLCQKIYDARDIWLEPLGLRFKRLSADVLAAILLPLLEFGDKKGSFGFKTLDVQRIREVYKIYKQYKNKNYMRVALIAGDFQVVYQMLKKEGFVVEDEYNKTVITNDGIYFTVNHNSESFFKIIKNYNILVMTFDFFRTSYFNGILDSHLIDQKIFNEINFNNPVDTPFIFHILLHSLGMTHIELQFFHTIYYVEDSNIELVIENCETNFIDSYLYDVLKKDNHELRNKRKDTDFYKINYLLKNYKITILKDFSFSEALELYYDLHI